ncbi:hypothetical protein ACWF2L_30510 [Streptomyces anulatus]
MSLPDTAELPAPADPLPPYSGTDTVCAMCSHTSAYTRFQAERHRVMREFNGVVRRHATLTARLERQCERCDYQWDEAPNPAPGIRPATAAEIAEALQNAHQGWALDLSSGCAGHMAEELMHMLDLYVRPDHPLWKQQHAPRPPLIAPADVDLLTDPAQTATVPIFVDAPERRPQAAPEARPNPIGPVTPVPLHDKSQTLAAAPAGPTGFAAPNTGDDA